MTENFYTNKTNIKYFSIKVLLILVFSFILKVQSQHEALNVADSLYNLGDYSKAIRKYKKVIPQDQYTLLQIAKANKAIGMYDSAMDYYGKIAIEYPSLTSAKLEYAKLLIITNNNSKADSLYTILASEYPTNPNFQFNLGLVKEKLKDTLAIQYFERAFFLDSTHQKSCFKIAKYNLQKRNYDKVLEIANSGLRSYPNNVKLIGIIGQNFLLKEDYYNAIPYFEKLVILNQENEYIHSRLGLCYNKTSDFEKAITHLKKALKYNDKIPERYAMLGYAYQKLEKFDKALENYQTALKLKDLPLEEELMSIALVYRFQEHWKNAIKYTKLAIKENPQHQIANYQLAMFADAYYKDPKIKIDYYKRYYKNFGKVKEAKYFNHMVEKRIIQLEKEIEASNK